MDYLLGGALGAIVAFVFSIPAIVLEYTSHGKIEDTPLVMDVKTIFGLKLKKSEIFLVSLLLHIVVGFLFGLVYIVFVQQGWSLASFAPFTIQSFFVYAVMSWVVVNIILYPLLNMGLFAHKEGSHVWLQTLLSHLLLGLAIWLLVQYYQPFYFMPTL